MEIMLIEYADKKYPQRLKNIKNPPSRLYAIGNIDCLNEIGIAVIGSRTNTIYGEKMCKKFTKELVEYNINIISGLAYGIDSIAHQTCLMNSGKTIAVLPSGLKNISKATNIKLVDYIIKNNGAIISEYENDVSANSNKFLERNRIVAGLSIGTLVIEAGYRSGTSVTARYTIENNRCLLCVPSSLENIKGKTTNQLIQKGAKLVTCAEDIIKEINQKNPELKLKKKKVKDKELYLDISPELIDVYSKISDIPIDVNSISIQTKLSIGDVNYKLMLLQLSGKIIELPGKRFIKKK